MFARNLDPVFTGLRWGLHALVLGLAAFAVLRAFVIGAPDANWILAVATAFMAVYLVGACTRPEAGNAEPSRRGSAVSWLGTLALLWSVLVWLSPDGAYILFPLFFLFLHLLPGIPGVLAVIAATAFAVTVLGVHQGFSVGGVTGPVLGAGVALLIGLGHHALRREATERERLLAELMRTRTQLADTEREQGALTERARLARDIHDTVAQGLSSIQMLLRAAERDTPEPGAGYLRLARETAADSLTETRHIIGKLTPARLEDGLPAALRRLGAEQAERSGIPISVCAAAPELPMSLQTALLRIAQGALANAIRHAQASEISIKLSSSAAGVSLAVSDNGCGFDTFAVANHAYNSGSFGLHAMHERVGQLSGELEINSTPGQGTCITARLPVNSPLGSHP